MSETFVAIVGKTKKKFIMHTAITTRSSDFFTAAMSREWKEGQEKEVTLPDADEDAFAAYLQWMYTGELTLPKGHPFRALTGYYILGDFLGDSAFREAVLDGIVNLACEEDSYPGVLSIKAAWERTPKDSPIRKLYLQIWASTSSMRSRLEYIGSKNYPRAFVHEFFQYFLTLHGLEKYGVARHERHRLLKEYRSNIAEQQAGNAER